MGEEEEERRAYMAGEWRRRPLTHMVDDVNDATADWYVRLDHRRLRAHALDKDTIRHHVHLSSRCRRRALDSIRTDQRRKPTQQAAAAGSGATTGVKRN